jgi:hypothetical protein
MGTMFGCSRAPTVRISSTKRARLAASVELSGWSCLMATARPMS